VTREAHTHESTLVNAISAALDRVEHHLEHEDEPMASVSGAVVRKLLAHPLASMYSSDLAWRRMLSRWEPLRVRLGAPPLDVGDIVDHYANCLLIEATRKAEQSVAGSAA
jgi:hypothetical protein